MDKYAKRVLRLLIKCQYYEGDVLFLDADAHTIRPICAPLAVDRVKKINFDHVPAEYVRSVLEYLSSCGLLSFKDDSLDYFTLTHEGTVFFSENRKKVFFSFLAPSLFGYFSGTLAYHVETEYQLLNRFSEWLRSFLA